MADDEQSHDDHDDHVDHDDHDASEESASSDMRDDDLLVLEQAENLLPVWEPTGEPRVDSALDMLAALDPDDVHQHAEVFNRVHEELRGTLADLDSSA